VGCPMSDWKLINTSTASGASSVEFTDLTGYKIFKWVWININPSVDNAYFEVNAKVSGGAYSLAKTTTYFVAYHNENGTGATLGYSAGDDQAQGTGYQRLSSQIGNGVDESSSGEMLMFNPASTTYVKHFYSRSNNYQGSNYTQDTNVGGYINTASALAGVRLQCSSGTFDGTIKQYGLVAG